MNTMEVKHEKCYRCKCWRLPASFLNSKGRKLKCCSNCREKYKCAQCDYKSAIKSNLKIHIKQVHDKIKDIKCPQCDYKCSSKSHLKIHIKRIHDKVKNFECNQCDYKCSTKSDLTKHIKWVHVKVKNFECNQCDYKCPEKSSLKIHIKSVHEKIKDIECPHDNCDFKCSRKSSLTLHIKSVHYKIKKFRCPQCNFKSAQKSNLDTHVKICTGEENISSGELRVKKALEAMEIKFVREYTPEKLQAKKLRYDFYLPDYDLYIEYDGRQHFRPVRFGGMSTEQAKENLHKCQRNDSIKDNFAKDKLLRIKYTEFGKIPQLITEFITQRTDWGVE